jgi:hypothetical protein
MPVEKLTAVLIGQHYADRYAAILTKLDEWEQAKAHFLVEVGKECLALIRKVLEPLPEHDVAGRKAARAQTVKAIEDQLPEAEGIGAPQVNRWIRWAGAGEVICSPDDLTWPGGLKQAHLMVLEKFIEQHEPTATFRFKEPWKNKLDDVQEIVSGTVETGASAKELEEAIDDEAEFPKPPEPKEQPCPKEPSTSSPVTPTSASEGSPDTKPTTGPKASPSLTGPAQSTPASSGSKSESNHSKSDTPASTSSATRSAPSPSAAPCSPARSRPNAADSSTSGSAPSAKELADQAFQILQQPEVLAGVFRREIPPEMALAIVDNMIRACGEKSRNPLALAKAFHRMAPFVLTYFESYVDEGKFKLRKKDHPEPPTLEQLAPAAELATA